MEILDGVLNHLRFNCPRNITDLVFLEIENHYLVRYEHLANISTQDTLNKNIGKFVRAYWDLKNIGIYKFPQSRLIRSYTEHSN